MNEKLETQAKDIIDDFYENIYKNGLSKKEFQRLIYDYFTIQRHQNLQYNNPQKTEQINEELPITLEPLNLARKIRWSFWRAVINWKLYEFPSCALMSKLCCAKLHENGIQTEIDNIDDLVEHYGLMAPDNTVLDVKSWWDETIAKKRQEFKTKILNNSLFILFMPKNQTIKKSNSTDHNLQDTV